MAYKILKDPKEIADLKQRLLNGEFPMVLAKQFGIGEASIYNWKKKFARAEPDIVFPVIKGKKRPKHERTQIQPVQVESIHTATDSFSNQISGVTRDTQEGANIKEALEKPTIKTVKTLKYIVNGVQVNIPQSVPVEIDPSAKSVSITKDAITVEF